MGTTPVYSQKHTECVVGHGRIVVIEDSFPVISETFILDQITGLIDRGLRIENWALYYLDQGVCHPKVIDYDLVGKTHYLKLPENTLRSDPVAWTSQLAARNSLGDLSNISAFHVNYGTNFLTFEPLFQVLDCYLIVSFYGFDASSYIIENGDHCFNTLFKRADLITANSIQMMDGLVRKGCPSDKIKVIRCGVEIPSDPVVYRNSTSNIILLSVARFVEKKGIEFALRALAVCSVRSTIRYRIVGDGPLKEELQQLASQLGISDQVEFLGFLPLEKMQAVMRQADIVLLTSVTAKNGDQEGLPVALVAAQAMGLPVISSYHSGIPELIIHGVTGLLSQERDVNQIATNIQMLVNDPDLRRKLGTNGRERVRAGFDKEIQNDRLAQLILKGSRGKLSEQGGIRSEKAIHELAYWQKRKGQETILSNAHYEKFYTEFFGIENSYYDGKKILDVGCGPRGSLEWAHNASERIGLDPLADDYLQLNHGLHKMRYIPAPAEHIPFKDEYFDVVCSFNSLDHVDNLSTSIKEIKRVLALGGKFLLITDVNHKPTVCEPIAYSWNIVDKFYPDLTLIDKTCYEKSPDGIYASIEMPYDFNNKLDRYGVLAAQFIKMKRCTSHPLISVLIPTFNRQLYLAHAIKSALNQSYDSFEVVVVDDGSTDSTADVVLQFSDSRLRYILKEHSGAPATRNRCICEAQGKYLLWLDSDDVLLPDVIAAYSKVIRQCPAADVIYGSLLATDSNLNLIQFFRYEDWHGRNDELVAGMFEYNRIPNPGTLVRKSCYAKFGNYNLEFPRCHDYEFWMRLAGSAVFKYADIPVLCWRWHGGNMSTPSVARDTRYEARVVHEMVQQYQLEWIFPNLPWKSDLNLAKAEAYLLIAKKLEEYADFKGALQFAYQSTAHNMTVASINEIVTIKKCIMQMATE